MKNTFVIILLLFFNYINAQFPLQNGSFETINGSTNILQTAFTQQQLGPNWYAYQNTSPNIKSNGFQNVNATHGTKFAHAWHKLESLGGPNWKRTGQAFFMYYPMQGGEHYNLQFDLKSSKTGTRFYVVAVNNLVPNTTGTQVNHILPTNASNNLNNIISNTGHKEFVNPTINYIANTGWNHKSYNFQPTQNFKYLLFIPYIELNVSNLSTKQADFYVDNVKMTGNLASTVYSMILNGQDSDTNVGINICNDGEDVILDASNSVDTHLHLRSYVQINQQNSNGTTSKWSTHTIFGFPFSPINISQLYAQDGFSFSSPAGVQTEYRVKYSFNSGPNNQWYSRTMKVYVDGGPNFNFGGMINWISINGGFSATSNVTGLAAGNYSYQWHEGTSTNTPIIGTSNQIQVYKNTGGNYPYTVRVTDLNTGCSAVKTTMISYHERGEKRISDKPDNAFKIYPNPATDHINISTRLVYDSINIYTLRNGLVMKTKGNKTIDVSSLKKGIYIMRFLDGDRIVETKKIIKN